MRIPVHLWKTLATVLVHLLYVFLFYRNYPVFQAAGILAILPVITAAWLYGLRFGLLSALFTLSVNISGAFYYHASMKFENAEQGMLLGNAMLFLVGIAVGHMRSLSAKQKVSLDALKRKNDEIILITESIIHDLKKPLTAMKTFYSLMGSEQSGWLSETGREAAKTGRESILYMQELLDDLLDCARLESGTLAPEFEVFPLEECLAPVRERLKLQIQEMKIDFSFPEGVAVRADRKLLTKIFMNLVGNAVAYIGSPDRPFVRVSVKENGKERTLSVSDNGLGIPEESRPGIFGKFKRGKNVEEIHGTGLGLSIVKAAVEAQGGTIRFESEEGKGTTFYFTLPKAG